MKSLSLRLYHFVPYFRGCPFCLNIQRIVKSFAAWSLGTSVQGCFLGEKFISEFTASVQRPPYSDLVARSNEMLSYRMSALKAGRSFHYWVAADLSLDHRRTEPGSWRLWVPGGWALTGSWYGGYEEGLSFRAVLDCDSININFY